MMLMRAFVGLLLLGVALAIPVSFTGTWTDTRRFGGDLFLCTPTATTLYGSFSDYGVMVGTLKNFRTVEGRWFEACNGRCCRGEFELELSSDGNSFSGSWACAENTRQRFTWKETRNLAARTQTPNSYQCAVMTTVPGSDMGHRWLLKNTPGGNEWDICLDRTKQTYSSSYFFLDSFGLPVLGYESGNIHQAGRITQGYYDERVLKGASLTVRLADNEALNIYWNIARNTSATGVEFYDRVIYSLDQSGEPTSEECSRHEYLSTAPQETKNAASALLAMPLLVVAAAVVAVVAF